MAVSVVLSTEGLPEKETAPAWHDWMAQLFSGLDTDLYGDTCFDGRINVSYAGDVMLTKLEAGRHRVQRHGAGGSGCQRQANQGRGAGRLAGARSQLHRNACRVLAVRTGQDQ